LEFLTDLIALVQELIGIGNHKISIGSELRSSFIYQVQGNIYMLPGLYSVRFGFARFPFLNFILNRFVFVAQQMFLPRKQPSLFKFWKAQSYF
jgi:hypothetical protein